jgi:3'-5' exoribonuclease
MTKRPTVKLHELAPGRPADFFALLAERAKGLTRDGKPFYTCRFRDKQRTLVAMVWGDHPLFPDCDALWQAGKVYKVRGAAVEHERYGVQLELQQVREARDDDRADGYAEGDFFERSRFDSDVMLLDLRALADAEISDAPLRKLVVGLLDAHAGALKALPADPRRYFPFPGGWLEHTLSVARSCLLLADRYRLHYPELTPPLNRDLILAGAVLHEIGRVAELTAGLPGQPAEPTVAGHLFGHQLLGRDLIRTAAKDVADLNPELLVLLEHVVLSHLTRPEWGSVRQPLIPEVLILHHADDLDAKLETYVRCLTRDPADGPLTDRDPVIGRPLLKGRAV